MLRRLYAFTLAVTFLSSARPAGAASALVEEVTGGWGIPGLDTRALTAEAFEENVDGNLEVRIRLQGTITGGRSLNLTSNGQVVALSGSEKDASRSFTITQSVPTIPAVVRIEAIDVRGQVAVVRLKITPKLPYEELNNELPPGLRPRLGGIASLGTSVSSEWIGPSQVTTLFPVRLPHLMALAGVDQVAGHGRTLWRLEAVGGANYVLPFMGFGYPIAWEGALRWHWRPERAAIAFYPVPGIQSTNLATLLTGTGIPSGVPIQLYQGRTVFATWLGIGMMDFGRLWGFKLRSYTELSKALYARSFTWDGGSTVDHTSPWQGWKFKELVRLERPGLRWFLEGEGEVLWLGGEGQILIPQIRAGVGFLLYR